jgi:hypothetical protein
VFQTLSKLIFQKHKRRCGFSLLFLLFSSRRPAQVLIAARDIRIGEEINDCYIELRKSTAKRRELLQEIYRFHCECPACQDDDLSHIEQLSFHPTPTLSPAATIPSDAARERALYLDQQILTMAEEGESPYQIISIAQELLNLLQSSPGNGWRERYLGEAFLSIYHLALTLSEMEGEEPQALMKSSSALKSQGGNSSRKAPKYYQMAVEHLRSAHHWNVLLQGQEGPDSLITHSYLQLHKCLKLRHKGGAGVGGREQRR